MLHFVNISFVLLELYYHLVKVKNPCVRLNIHTYIVCSYKYQHILHINK